MPGDAATKDTTLLFSALLSWALAFRADGGTFIVTSSSIRNFTDFEALFEDGFAGVHDEASSPFVRDTAFSPSDEVQDNGSISGSEDVSDDNGDELPPQFLYNEEQATFQRRMIPEICDSSVQTDPVEFRAPEVESLSYFIDGFSMSGAVRSGGRSVSEVSLQCSLRPDCKDASCSASFAQESSLSGAAAQVQDLDNEGGPHSAQLHDVIAHQRQVILFLPYAAQACLFLFSSNYSFNFRLSKISSVR